MLIAGSDNTLYLNPAILVEKVSYTWNDTLNLGKENFAICHLFPYGCFWYFLQKLDINNVLIEKMWFIFIWFIGSFSIYKLTAYLTKFFKYSTIAGLFAALLYQFNTYKMVGVLDVPKHLTYMILPLLLYLFIKGLDDKKSVYAIYFALTTLLFASAWVNPPMAVIAFIPPFFYFFYYLLINRNNNIEFKKSFLFVGKLLISLLAINLWWIVPFYQTINASVEDIKTVALSFGPTSTDLFEVFRFLGKWSFRSSHYLMPYVPYHNIYYNTPLLFLTYLFFLIALVPLFYLRRLNRKIMYFYLLLIIGVYLTAGKSLSLGFSFLYRYLPGFWIFREPYTKFTPLNTLSISVLFGIAIMFFFYFIDKKLINVSKNLFCKVISSIILIGIILISAFPLLTGDCIWHYRYRGMRSNYVKIPEYWTNIGSWLKNNSPHTRIFVTPKSSYGHNSYNWESGVATGGSGVSWLLIPNPYLTYNTNAVNASQKMINLLYDNFVNLKKDLPKALSLFGVRYVLQKNDLAWRFAFKDTYSPEKMRRILKSQGVYLKESFGKLDLYEVSDEYFLPRVFSSTTLIAISGKIDGLMPMTEMKYLGGKR